MRERETLWEKEIERIYRRKGREGERIYGRRREREITGEKGERERDKGKH